MNKENMQILSITKNVEKFTDDLTTIDALIEHNDYDTAIKVLIRYF